MSFRARLLLFFTIIVVVPMVAVALVLFSLAAESETGKADSRIATGTRVAFSVYADARAEARDDLNRLAADPGLQSALARRDLAGAGRRLLEVARARRSIEGMELYDANSRRLVRAGARPETAVAPATAALREPGGGRIGSLTVSVTGASAYLARVKRMTGLEGRLLRDGRSLASTLPGDASTSMRAGDVEIAGQSYRARLEPLRQPIGPTVQLALYQPSEGAASSVGENRLLIGAILLAFLVLSLVASIFVVRALQSQIDQFLVAARRIGGGDFSHPVPVEGGDEFAALGAEFNKMSEQLQSKIHEVERSRRELEETIRRVGDAFAAALDRRGIVLLAVRTAVEACDAQAGRALPVDPEKMQRAFVGADEPELLGALEAAEREVFKVRPQHGSELMGSLRPGSPGWDEVRRPLRVEGAGAHALAMPLRVARVSPDQEVEYAGVIAIARDGPPFSESEEDLFAYLAGQAAVSIENANLHETVQRQAVTDELTGLSNLRRFEEALGTEIERSRRYSSDVGLVMLDLDDFKTINDDYGHQQGDKVLREAGRILRELSRDIDESFRYGGEELAVILPETDLAGAELAAERMRAAIEELQIERLNGGDPLRITASFGVAALPESADGAKTLVAAADAALYRAKRAGKNRVERAERAPAPR